MPDGFPCVSGICLRKAHEYVQAAVLQLFPPHYLFAVRREAASRTMESPPEPFVSGEISHRTFPTRPLLFRFPQPTVPQRNGRHPIVSMRYGLSLRLEPLQSNPCRAPGRMSEQDVSHRLPSHRKQHRVRTENEALRDRASCNTAPCLRPMPHTFPTGKRRSTLSTASIPIDGGGKHRVRA